MITTQKIIQTLKTIIDPEHRQDIVTLGYARNLELDDLHATFDMIMPKPNATLMQKAREAVLALGIREVTIHTPAPQPTQTSFTSQSSALNKVKHIIAVSSCKGGVGKSTIAANLAMELNRRGLKVGLADADIYGPSVPTLFHIHQSKLEANKQNQLLPLEKNGLKIMSFGFLLGDNPAVMRGPIVTRYIQQLLLNSAWGELDYLIIDMPPGTGDIHLTITQSIRLSGAIIITTPHTLSLTDVARGILMFEKVNVPILGIIENMTYFSAPGETTKHFIFGQSAAQNLEKQFGIKTLTQIPISDALGKINDGFPAVVQISEAVDKMINTIAHSTDITKHVPAITFNDIETVLTWKNGEEWKVNNRQLRLNSQDALSVNELTGEKIIQEDQIRRDIAPKNIVPIGNYAINVVWNDGHSAGIYSYELIKSLATITTPARHQ